MNIESVKTLFELFSGESADNFIPLVRLAVDETEKMLLPDADASDIRLEFLAAAVANHRFRRIMCTRDRTQSTYAGKMPDLRYSSVSGSEKLLRDYLTLCKKLIKPQTFAFAAFSGKEEIC